MKYAGFWKRLWAYSIDAVILQLVMIPLAMLMPAAPMPPENEALMRSMLQGGLVTPEQLNNLLGGLLNPAMTYAFLGLAAVYNIGFVASAWQATPGKRWYNMKVVTRDGAALTLVQSTFRHVACGLSTLLGGLGYVLAAFHPEKAALHDVLVNTRVVYREDV